MVEEIPPKTNNFQQQSAHSKIETKLITTQPSAPSHSNPKKPEIKDTPPRIIEEIDLEDSDNEIITTVVTNIKSTTPPPPPPAFVTSVKKNIAPPVIAQPPSKPNPPIPSQPCPPASSNQNPERKTNLNVNPEKIPEATHVKVVTKGSVPPPPPVAPYSKL